MKTTAIARMMIIQGWLLIGVAATHLAMTSEIGHIVSVHTAVQAFAFLAAAIILAVLGIWMLVPLLWIRKEFFHAGAA